MLTVAMIVRDEAANIVRCLASVFQVADEVVLVDTGSVDGTAEIADVYAHSIGRKIEHRKFEWVDDFAAARNYSFSQATMPWVMWVDADDAIPPETIDKINELKQCNVPIAHGFRLNNVGALPGTTLRDREGLYQIRMVCSYMLDPWKNTCGNIHESLTDSCIKYRLRFVDHEEQINHYGYSNQTLLDKKIERNIRLILIGLGIRESVKWLRFCVGKYRVVYADNCICVFDVLKMVAHCTDIWAYGDAVGIDLGSTATQEDIIMSIAISLVDMVEKQQPEIYHQRNMMEAIARIENSVREMEQVGAATVSNGFSIQDILA